MSWGWFWGVGLCLLAACGGPSPANGPEPPTNGEDPLVGREGHIYVENRTAFPLEIAFADRRDPEDWRIVRLQVAAGQRLQVSEAIWPPGYQLDLDGVLLLPQDRGFRVRRKVSVTVDGDVDLVFQLEGEDPFSAQFLPL